MTMNGRLYWMKNYGVLAVTILTVLAAGIAQALRTMDIFMDATVDGDLGVTGTVGVGTATPGRRLHVKKDSGDAIVKIENSGNGNTSGVEFSRERLSGTGVTGGAIWMDSDTATNNSKLIVEANSYLAVGGALLTNQRLTIDSSADVFTFQNGKVGIGTTAPIEFLTLDGEKSFAIYGEDPGGYPDSDEDYAKFYVVDGEMWVQDENGSDSQLSSHADPGTYAPGASSSFDNPDVDLPFSFHHSNRFIGKGAVVDVAAVVAEVERMSGKDLTAEYDLPAERRLNATEWLASQRTAVVERAKQRVLEDSPEVKIPIGEAWEEVEIMEATVTVQTATRYEYDLGTEQVALVEEPVEVLEQVGTGQFERRLKEDVRFDQETGKFFRQRTIEEIDTPTIREPDLPQWIRDRIP
jgi:hypothetical protein